MRIEIRLNIETTPVQKNVSEIIDFEEIRVKLKDKYLENIKYIEELGNNKKIDFLIFNNNLFIKYYGDIENYQKGLPSNIFFILGNSENDINLNFSKYISEFKNIFSLLSSVENIQMCNFRLKIHIERSGEKNDTFLNNFLDKLVHDFSVKRSLFSLTKNEKIDIETKYFKTFVQLNDILKDV